MDTNFLSQLAEQESPAHLREPELARRWRVSVRTLQRWRHEGRGPAYIRLESRIIYPVAEVLAHEKRLLVGGRAVR